MPSRLSLLWNTARYMSGAQLRSRGRLRLLAYARRVAPSLAQALYTRRAARLALRVGPRLVGLTGAAVEARAAMSDDDRRRREAAFDSVAAGTFRFLNDTRALGRPIDWTAPGASLLWRYHLHYTDFLLETALGRDSAAEAMFALVREWTSANPLGGTSDAYAWHPYVVSLRLVNWIVATAAVTNDAASMPEDIADVIVRHALFVEENLETDVGGNHLLKNLKALIFAGAFFNGSTAARWIEDYSARFEAALEKQVLADGGHFERSPMYHAEVMSDVIEVVAALQGVDRRPSPGLLQLLRRMDGFLKLVTHPDGEIALFNDSALGMAPTPIELHVAVHRLLGGGAVIQGTTPRDVLLLSKLRPEPAAHDLLPAVRNDDAIESGYFVQVVPERRAYMIVDAGAICPDELPAHGHADMLSYEFTVDDVRLIVDSGVSEYASGQWREYYRSTRAHNTVVVDGQDQSECWNSFRVARRAQPRDVNRVRSAILDMIDARHTGYMRLSGRVSHRRRVLLVARRFWLVQDILQGGGAHAWISAVHLHPDVHVETRPFGYRIRRGTACVDLVPSSGGSRRIVQGETSIIQGWYAPEFGVRFPAPTILFAGEGALPITFGYVLVPVSGEDVRVRVDWETAANVRVDLDGHTFRVDASRDLPIVEQRLIAH